jgi:hypothetical protein
MCLKAASPASQVGRQAVEDFRADRETGPQREAKKSPIKMAQEDTSLSFSVCRPSAAAIVNRLPAHWR